MCWTVICASVPESMYVEVKDQCQIFFFHLLSTLSLTPGLSLELVTSARLAGQQAAETLLILPSQHWGFRHTGCVQLCVCVLGAQTQTLVYMASTAEPSPSP